MILNALSHHTGVEAGAAYRRTGAGALVETAYVQEVTQDKMGIPHVRFELHVARGTGVPSVENRTLSLEAFQMRFREKLKD